MAEINIILNILETLKSEKPDSVFVNSLHDQFCNRGGLSKKQLEGLFSKAEKSSVISTANLATLDAIIKKKPTRYKSDIPLKAPEPEKKESVLPLIEQILEKFPQHKMALFLHTKSTNNQILTDAEIAEIKRLAKLLIK